MGNELSDIDKAFISALFKTFRNLANYIIVVLNLATVDVLGMCLYAFPIMV